MADESLSQADISELEMLARDLAAYMQGDGNGSCVYHHSLYDQRIAFKVFSENVAEPVVLLANAKSVIAMDRYRLLKSVSQLKPGVDVHAVYSITDSPHILQREDDVALPPFRLEGISAGCPDMPAA